MRQLLYVVFSHCDGQSRHGPCSIACVIAAGRPSRGMRTNVRRVAIPLRPSTPPALGLSPRKSKISQPSSDASASAACTAGRVSGVSISGGFRLLLAPVCAPFTELVPALQTGDVIDQSASSTEEQAQQLAKGGRVISAADRMRPAVHCYGIADAECERAPALRQCAVKETSGELPELAHCEGAGENRGDDMNRFSDGSRNRFVHVVGQNLSGVIEQLCCVRPASDQCTEAGCFRIRNRVTPLCRV